MLARVSTESFMNMKHTALQWWLSFGSSKSFDVWGCERKTCKLVSVCTALHPPPSRPSRSGLSAFRQLHHTVTPPPTSLFIYFHICVPSPTQAISVTGNLFPPASSFSSNSLIIVLFKKLINVGELMQDHEKKAKCRARLQTFRSWLRQGQALYIMQLCSCRIRRFMSPTPTFTHLLLAIFL